MKKEPINNYLVFSFYNPFQNAPRPAQLLGILDLLIEGKKEIDLFVPKINFDYHEHYRTKLYNLDQININQIEWRSGLERLIARLLSKYFLI